ncbi:MAG: NlpC/P60 family protein [Actinobacteria bacterium]|nr:NlpC/P60 family protein [Actinomycetota bacterium]
MNLRAKASGFIAITLVTAGILPAVTAQGAPIDDKRRQAAALQAQIDANGDKIVTLSERLNGARLRLDRAQAGIVEAERRTAEAQAETARVKHLLNARAIEIYKGAGASSPLDAMDVDSVADLGARSQYAAAAADRDDALLTKLQKAREDLADQKAQLEQQRAAAAAERDATDAARREIERASAGQKALLSQVNGEIATLMAQETARRDAEARARAAATATQNAAAPRRTTGPVNFPDVPAPNARAATAVAFAKAQVGKGYRYATSGPDTYDCSGLTASAWAAAGVSLAHYSGAQWQQTVHIGAGDLQAGDLIFYGPGGSNHVEIYIGGGMVVSASNPATGVKLSAVRYGTATGYGRVRG